jgi:hypothetical protein
MALFALQYADLPDLARKGRPFSCDTCQKDPQTKKHSNAIARLRRCREDRWDFTEQDGAVFPIQMEHGGPSFGFCPAKVLRDDQSSVVIFKTLIAILETGTWPDSGGLNEQESYWIDLVAEFGPMKKSLEFNQKFNAVAKSLSSKKTGAQNTGRRP